MQSYLTKLLICCRVTTEKCKSILCDFGCHVFPCISVFDRENAFFKALLFFAH